MSKPKIIVVGIPGDTPTEFAFSETAKLFDPEKVELLRVKAPDDLVAMVAGQQIHAVVLAGHHAKAPDAVAGFLMGPTILDNFPDGVALLDSTGGILWANGILQSLFNGRGGDSVNFLTALGSPTWAHPTGDRAIPMTWLHKESLAAAGGLILRMPDDRFLHLQSSPLFCLPDVVSESNSKQAQGGMAQGGMESSVVVVRDVSQTILEQQKRAAIHQAGQTLADLTPAELADMTVEERVELLKSNIIDRKSTRLNSSH